jgi:hypothetical protein
MNNDFIEKNENELEKNHNLASKTPSKDDLSDILEVESLIKNNFQEQDQQNQFSSQFNLQTSPETIEAFEKIKLNQSPTAKIKGEIRSIIDDLDTLDTDATFSDTNQNLGNPESNQKNTLTLTKNRQILNQKTDGEKIDPNLNSNQNSNPSFKSDSDQKSFDQSLNQTQKPKKNSGFKNTQFQNPSSYLRFYTHSNSNSKKIEQNSNHHQNPDIYFESKPSQNSQKTKKNASKPTDFSLVWQTISISLILGVIYMYFQGLQPLILRNYSQTITNQILATTTRFNLQTEAFLDLQKQINSVQSFDPSKLCSQTEPFQDGFSIRDEIKNLQQNLKPDQESRETKNWQNFYLQETRNVYQNFFNQYFLALNDISKTVNKTNSIPEFFEYRNILLTNCQAIEKTTELDSNVKVECLDLIEQNKKVAELKWFFWQAVKEDIDLTTTLCQQILDPNPKITYLQFQQRWLKSYNRLMSYKVVLLSLDNDVRTTSERFLTQSKESLEMVDKIAQKRQTLSNLWYFINYEN